MLNSSYLRDLVMYRDKILGSETEMADFGLTLLTRCAIRIGSISARALASWRVVCRGRKRAKVTLTLFKRI